MGIFPSDPADRAHVHVYQCRIDLYRGGFARIRSLIAERFKKGGTL